MYLTVPTYLTPLNTESFCMKASERERHLTSSLPHPSRPTPHPRPLTQPVSLRILTPHTLHAPLIPPLTAALAPLLQHHGDAVPLAVFAHKLDLPAALHVNAVAESLDLSSMGRPWHIEGSMGNNGTGLYEAMDWLSTALDAPRRVGVTSYVTMESAKPALSPLSPDVELPEMVSVAPTRSAQQELPIVHACAPTR